LDKLQRTICEVNFKAECDVLLAKYKVSASGQKQRIKMAVARLPHKEAPEKRFLSKYNNEKFVRKLVFLHNNLMQYYNISWEEVMMVYRQAIFVLNDPTPLIYYKPTILMTNFNEKPHLYQIWKVLEKYTTTGILTELDMKYANTVWQWLKEQTKIKTD